MNTMEKPHLEELSQAELFEKINDICWTVNSVIDTNQLLEISLAKTMELFNAERGSVFLVGDNKKDLVLQTAHGMAIREKEAAVKQMGKGIVGKVAENKRPIVVEDITSDDRFRNYKARKSYRTSSFICAPLLVKDQLIGVINITDKISRNQFRKDEMQLLDFLATQIALNFRRIELYEKFKTIVQESLNLKDELGKSSQEASTLKKQVIVQEKLASIGKLAGGIAHEFNNPLDGIIRYTNLCLEQVKEEDVIYGYLLEIKQGLNRMVSIVRNLLACSRNPVPKSQKIDLNQAIEQSVQSVRDNLLSKDVAIEKDYTKDSVALTNMGIDRIFYNILQNAIDAIGQKGLIRITSRVENNVAKVEIEDNGCGIPQDKVAMIFEPFYTTKDIEKGCGLGLTIVSEIVKSYDGWIDVKSEKQAGTRITVSLPVK